MSVMRRPPSLLREMTETAWATSRTFAFVFEFAFWLEARKTHHDDRETRLYAICEANGAAWKFGVSDSPEKRLGSLQVGNPRQLVLYAHAPAHAWMERFIHRTLRRHRLQGEWFAAAPRTLTIAHLIEVAHEQTHDVLETLAVGERLIADDTVAALCFQFDEAFAC